MPSALISILILAAEIVGVVFVLGCLSTLVNLWIEGRWPFNRGEE